MGEAEENPKDKEEPASAVKAGDTKTLSAKEVIELVWNMEEGEKEKVIEEVSCRILPKLEPINLGESNLYVRM